MEESSDLQQFYYAVAKEALSLGYNILQVGIFEADIVECFNKGKSVEQTIEEVF